MLDQVIRVSTNSRFQILKGAAAKSKTLTMLLLLFLLPTLLLAAPLTFSPALTYSYSVEEPSIGLSFGQQQAVDGEDLVGEYRVLLPGTRRRRARQFNYGATNSLEVGPAGHFSYSVNYRL